MDPVIMSGRPVADACKEKIKKTIDAVKAEGRDVNLAILSVGDDSASRVYRNRLLKMSESLGIGHRVVELPADTSTEDVIRTMQELNEDPSVTGILPLMPMPESIDAEAVCAALASEKDMDCLHPMNGGMLLTGQSRWAACTPRACMAILKFYGIPIIVDIREDKKQGVAYIAMQYIPGKSLQEIADETAAGLKAKDAVMDVVRQDDSRIEYRGLIKDNQARLVATIDTARQEVGILLLVGEGGGLDDVAATVQMANPRLAFGLEAGDR